MNSKTPLKTHSSSILKYVGDTDYIMVATLLDYFESKLMLETFYYFNPTIHPIIMSDHYCKTVIVKNKGFEQVSFHSTLQIKNKCTNTFPNYIKNQNLTIQKFN